MNLAHDTPEVENQDRNQVAFGSCTAALLRALHVRPLRGRLRHLRTKAEVLHQDETVEVYYCAIEARDASRVLSTIKLLLNQADNSFLHLRRFVKPAFLPPDLRLQWNFDSDDDNKYRLASGSQYSQPLYVLLAPTSSINLDTLSAALAVEISASHIYTAAVPKYPPSSPTHAAHLTATLWPTIFTNTNAFGPHYALVDRATRNLEDDAGLLMGLAARLGTQDLEVQNGIGVGVVVTEGEGLQKEIVALAGDGRFADRASVGGGGGGGDPALHAVMRAIAFVARKRRTMASSSPVSSSTPSSVSPVATRGQPEPAEKRAMPVGIGNSASRIHQDTPLTDLEAQALGLPNLRSDGYLCQHLTFYVTHEPCVMCSMALVHSRVERVVIGTGNGGKQEAGAASQSGTSGEAKNVVNKMARRRTGGLVVGEDGSGYGLFWRAELNWRFMCWEYAFDDDEKGEVVRIDDDVHV